MSLAVGTKCQNQDKEEADAFVLNENVSGT